MSVKDWVLFAAGLAIILVDVITTEWFHGASHSAFLVLGLALCGVGASPVVISRLNGKS